MSNPLHAAHYADHALQRSTEIIENVRLAQGTYRVRFRCPEIAKRVLPGQFLMLRFSNSSDPLIGRPLAVYDVCPCGDGDGDAIDVVYLVKGKFTGLLAESEPGRSLDVWGPLGNGFPIDPTEHLIMVAGGIGQTPFLMLGQEYLGARQFGEPPRTAPPAKRVTICYGARTASLLAGVEDFERAGFDVRICTDDGSRGHHGLVTDVLRQVLDESSLTPRIVTCGPEVMMEAVTKVAATAGVPCQVSLETPMACGIGICFTCVAKVVDENGDWDYKRTCVEGPVFDGAKIQW